MLNGKIYNYRKEGATEITGSQANPQAISAAAKAGPPIPSFQLVAMVQVAFLLETLHPRTMAGCYAGYVLCSGAQKCYEG